MSFNKLTLISASLASVLVVGPVSAAFAENAWERAHPRRDQVNDRLQNQNHRINQAYHEGELTRTQARQLHRDDHQIRQEERYMASQNGGHITRAEQRVLNQQENGVNRQFGRDGSQWASLHPRRDEVNDRLENQGRRIGQEYREGELTRGQAQQLHRDDGRILQEERDMTAMNGGYITRGEQRVLNQQENGVSRQIGY
jgi:CRISPR/Cas system-associated endoribonuclease Cas2